MTYMPHKRSTDANQDKRRITSLPAQSPAFKAGEISGVLARDVLIPRARFQPMSKILAVALCFVAGSAFAYSGGINGVSQQGCGNCHNSSPTPTVSLNGPS